MYVIASSRENFHEEMVVRLTKLIGEPFIYISDKAELNYERLRDINPRYIFFPHWSYIIPENVYKNFECIIFHMTDLPFGRGGSPLQNLIASSIYNTKISALRCEAGIDTGHIYMKKPLSLYGSAEEIYIRVEKIVGDMVISIIKDNPVPLKQSGEVTFFKRRKPSDGDISGLTELDKIFDYIRMLDADGYPNAFIETEHVKFEFNRASLKKDKIIADVKITLKDR